MKGNTNFVVLPFFSSLPLHPVLLLRIVYYLEDELYRLRHAPFASAVEAGTCVSLRSFSVQIMPEDQ